MYEIVINDDADEELVAAAVFYESREPGLGEEFLHEFFEKLSKNTRTDHFPQPYSSIIIAVT